MVIILIAILSVVLAACLGTLVHLFACALVCRLVGYQIHTVSFGFGKCIFIGRLFDIETRIFVIPFDGSVYFFLPFYSNNRASLIALAAGPVIDTLFLAFLITLIWVIHDPVLRFAVLLPAIVWRLLEFWEHVWPRKILVNGKQVSNDGMSLWEEITAKEDYLKPYRDAYLDLLLAYWHDPQKMPQLTAQSVRIASYLDYLDHFPLWETDQTIAALEREMAAGMSMCEELATLETLMTVVLSQDDQNFLEELDRWSSRALALNPELDCLKSSRGSVLVVLGRYAEAMAMLQDAENDDRVNNGLNNAFQALALFRSGHFEAAAAKFDAALAFIEDKDRRGARVESLLDRIGSEIGHNPVPSET